MGGTQTWPHASPSPPEPPAPDLAGRLTALAADIAAAGGIGAVKAIQDTRADTPGGRLALRLLAAVAEFERAEAQRLAGEAFAAAGKGAPGKGGRPRALNEEGERLVLELAAGEIPVAQIARAAGVGRPTVVRVLERHGVRPGKAGS
jgi:DNA invertase Pin-like site-specific DNA recombinase